MKYLSILILVLSLSSCGTNAKSDDTSAVLIPSPISGYKCFGISVGGKIISGNCVKE